MAPVRGADGLRAASVKLPILKIVVNEGGVVNQFDARCQGNRITRW